ncbi:hypothetical protein ACFL4U_04035 [Candidatus Neomarinimicrobiota bacterium]
MKRQSEVIEHKGKTISLYENDEDEYGKLRGEYWTVVAIIKPGVMEEEYSVIVGIGNTIFEARKDAVDRARKFIDSHTT